VMFGSTGCCSPARGKTSTWRVYELGQFGSGGFRKQIAILAAYLAGAFSPGSVWAAAGVDLQE